MGISANAADLKLVHTDKKPVLIQGEQGRLFGSLDVQNVSDNRLTLKSIPIQSAKLRGQGNVALSSLRVRGRLNPKEQARVNIDYQIDPATPPGIYKATLLIGGEEQAAEINIAENAELETTPYSITLNTNFKPNYSPKFTFTNTGNVDISLGEKMIIPVKSDQALGTALQRGITKLVSTRSADEIQLRDILTSVAGHLAGSLTINWEPTVLKPGDTQSIQAKIELPDNLQPHSYYYAELELYSSDVRVDIYT